MSCIGFGLEPYLGKDLEVLMKFSDKARIVVIGHVFGIDLKRRKEREQENFV